MATNYTGERWKPVETNFGQVGNSRLEVSNFGRIRTFNKNSNGNVLKGSLIKGYPIIRLKFYKAHNETALAELAVFNVKINNLEAKKYQLSEQNVSEEKLLETTKALKQLKKKYKEMQAAYTKARTINYHSLVHRLVATYFLLPPKKDQTIVTHMDFDKLNNRSSNLKWMTHEESVAYQTNNPLVIANKANQKGDGKLGTRSTKLTTTKVMLLKKQLNEGRNIKAIVKQFKITDTQVLRIKRGENWGDVPAAK